MSSKKSNGPLKTMLVAPTVTDPSMRNPKGPAEMLLSTETDDDHDTIFGAGKTKEEQEVSKPDESNSNNTMLVIVFALIVIALVAMIVWMMMKQSNDKKDEEEVRKMLHPPPHPRNNMPPGRMQGPNPQEQAAYAEHQRQMMLMHRQQQQMQEQMQAINAEMQPGQPNVQATEQPTPEPKPKKKKSKKEKSFAETMAEADGKVVPELKEPLLDEEPTQDKPKYNKKHPHPNIMRPGSAEDAAEVDDVLKQTSKALSKTSKKKKSGMSEIDKALLDKVHNNAEDSEEEQDSDITL